MKSAVLLLTLPEEYLISEMDVTKKNEAVHMEARKS